MDTGYSDSFQHLQDEMAWLDRVLHLAVQRARTSGGRWGRLCITDESVDALVGERPRGEPTSATEEALLQTVEATRAEIERRVAASEGGEGTLRLPRLNRLFALSPFERDVLVICLAPELDGKYERLYAYLQDDATRRSPTVELVFRLLCRAPREQVLGRGAFLASSRLMGYGLVAFADGGDTAPSLLSRALRLDEGIAHYLLGSRVLDPRIAHAAQLVIPDSWPDSWPDPGPGPAPEPARGTCEGTGDGARAGLLTSLQRYVAAPEPAPATAGPTGDGARAGLLTSLQRYVAAPSDDQWIAILHGADRAGQEETARWLCARAGLPLLRVDLDRLGDGDLSFERAMRLVFREAALRTAAVCVEAGEAFSREAEKDPARCRCLEAAMQQLGSITFLAGVRPWELQDGLKRQQCHAAEFPVPPYAERRQLWQASLDGDGAEAADLDQLAARFRFTRREIRNAVHAARNLARLRDGASAVATQADLQSACRAESSRRLNGLARKVETRYGWADLVLPANEKQQLREIAQHIQHHEGVYSDWGFGRKHTLGRGINILFSGASGTGKTMAAGIMAAELGLDLYKIDLSVIVSKYIGETEKNLARLFQEAESSNAILFFDEADALFGKRSEVKDSHDRYANIEVNFLLQKMEEHEGIVILATNLSKNLDDAFLRRLQFTVLFPFPEREERLEIWRRVFPSEAPLAADADLEFLARRLKIAGGNIKNIALGAAFLARAEGGTIGMRQIVLSAKREFQKVGKLCVKADFGDYHELVR